jgi:hypothetical protein
VVAAQVIHEGGEAVERERRQAHLAIVHGHVTVCTLYRGVVSVGASSVRRAPVLDRQRVVKVPGGRRRVERGRTEECMAPRCGDDHQSWLRPPFRRSLLRMRAGLSFSVNLGRMRHHQMSVGFGLNMMRNYYFSVDTTLSIPISKAHLARSTKLYFDHS